MNLMELMISVAVDSKNAVSDLGKVQTTAQKMGNGLKTAAKVGVAAIGAVTAATGALSAVVMKNVAATAEMGDTIDKQSQKMGISAEKYQEWSFIMEHCGTSIDGLQTGMKTLTTKAIEGSDAFEKLGISQQDLANMSQEYMFSAVITGLQNMTDPAERAATATQLLGKYGSELGPLLNSSAEDVEAMRQQVHDLGGVMSDEAVKNAAAFKDAVTNLQTAFQGVKTEMTQEFMPSMTTMMEGLTAVITGDETGFAKIEEGMSQFLDNLGNLVSNALPALGAIVSAFGEFAAKAIDKFVDYISSSKGQTDITNAVTEFAEWVGEHTGPFIEAGGKLGLAIVKGLVFGLIKAVQGSLVKKIDETGAFTAEEAQAAMDAGWAAWEAGDGLIGAMQAYQDTLMQAGIDSGKAYGNGLESPDVMDVLGMACNSLGLRVEEGTSDTSKLDKNGRHQGESYAGGILASKGEVDSAAAQIATASEGAKVPTNTAWGWGGDLVASLSGGMNANKSTLIAATKGLAAVIRQYLHFSEPDIGPLADFHTYAPDMVDLFVKGIDDNAHKIGDSFNKNLNVNMGEVSYNNSALARATAASINASSSVTDNIVLNVTSEIDGRILAQSTYNYVQAESRRRGTSLVTA